MCSWMDNVLRDEVWPFRPNLIKVYAITSKLPMVVVIGVCGFEESFPLNVKPFLQGMVIDKPLVQRSYPFCSKLRNTTRNNTNVILSEVLRKWTLHQRLCTFQFNNGSCHLTWTWFIIRFNTIIHMFYATILRRNLKVFARNFTLYSRHERHLFKMVPCL